MAEEFLHRADVAAVPSALLRAGLQEVSGEGMAESVAGDAFLDFCFLGGLFDSTLQARWVKMVAAFHPAVRVERAFGGREEVLPAQFVGGVGVFHGQGIGG